GLFSEHQVQRLHHRPSTNAKLQHFAVLAHEQPVPSWPALHKRPYPSQPVSKTYAYLPPVEQNNPGLLGIAANIPIENSAALGRIFCVYLTQNIPVSAAYGRNSPCNPSLLFRYPPRRQCQR